MKGYLFELYAPSLSIRQIQLQRPTLVLTQGYSGFETRESINSSHHTSNLSNSVVSTICNKD